MYIAKTRRCLKWKLDRELKRGRLLNVECIPRQIGKTELLVKVARDVGAVIVCPNLRWADTFRRKYLDISFMSVNELIRNQVFRGKVLLEEGIPQDIQKEIMRRYHVVGGYSGSSKNKTYITEGEIK